MRAEQMTFAVLPLELKQKDGIWQRDRSSVDKKTMMANHRRRKARRYYYYYYSLLEPNSLVIRLV